MTELLVVLLVTATAWRWWVARDRVGRLLAFTTTLVTFAVATKLWEPGMERLTGLHGVDDTLRHLTVVGVAMSLHAYLMEVRKGELRGRVARSTLQKGQATVIAGMLVIVAFISTWIFGLQPSIDASRLNGANRIFYGAYLTWVLAENVVLSVRISLEERHLPDSQMDTGRHWMIRLLALGSGIAVLYAVSRLVLGLYEVAQVDGVWMSTVTDLGLKTAMIGVGIAGLGVVVPAVITPGPSHRRLRQHLRALYPLWKDLSTAYPAEVLATPNGRTRASLRKRRNRKVVEIANIVNLLDLPPSDHPGSLAIALVRSRQDGFPSADSPAARVDWSTDEIDDLIRRVVDFAGRYSALVAPPTGGKP